jgi:Spx/MgsR family transcriptional regulator
MIHIYGLKNCDTTQKAIKWCKANGHTATFHCYKEEPPTLQFITTCLAQVPLTKLLNTQSTTYRSLSDQQKQQASSPQHASALLVQYPSLIKRPLIILPSGSISLGWREADFAALVATI